MFCIRSLRWHDIFNPFTADPIKPLHFAIVVFCHHFQFLTFGHSELSTRMSNIENGGLDQYGAEPFEQQQFGTAGVEGVNVRSKADK